MIKLLPLNSPRIYEGPTKDRLQMLRGCANLFYKGLGPIYVVRQEGNDLVAYEQGPVKQSLAIAIFKILAVACLIPALMAYIGAWFYQRANCIWIIPSEGNLDEDSEAIANLVPEQIRHLKHSINHLFPWQLKYVSPEMIPQVAANQVPYLEPEQVQYLPIELVGYVEGDQVTWLTPSQIPYINSEQCVFLNEDQIPYVPYDYIEKGALQDDQIGFLTDDQVAHCPCAQVRYLSDEQVPFLNVKQSWHLIVRQLQYLTQDQIPYIKQGAVRYLTPHQIPWITAKQVNAISPKQMGYLTPEQANHLIDVRKKVYAKIKLREKGTLSAHKHKRTASRFKVLVKKVSFINE